MHFRQTGHVVRRGVFTIAGADQIHAAKTMRDLIKIVAIFVLHFRCVAGNIVAIRSTLGNNARAIGNRKKKTRFLGWGFKFVKCE